MSGGALLPESEILGILGDGGREPSEDPLAGLLDGLFQRKQPAPRPTPGRSPVRPANPADAVPAAASSIPDSGVIDRGRRRPDGVSGTAGVGGGTTDMPDRFGGDASEVLRGGSGSYQQVPQAGGYARTADFRSGGAVPRAPAMQTAPSSVVERPAATVAANMASNVSQARGKSAGGSSSGSGGAYKGRPQSDDEMMVTSSASEPEVSAGSGDEVIPQRVRPTQTKANRQAPPTRETVVNPSIATRSGAESAKASAASAATVGVEDPESKHEGPEDSERLRHVRALGALHALRPSELSLVLSGWQCDWLLGREELCPPAALNAMLRLQARRRPRRKRGAERIAIGGAGGSRPSAMPVTSGSTALVRHDAVEMFEGVGQSNSKLSQYQKKFNK